MAERTPTWYFVIRKTHDNPDTNHTPEATPAGICVQVPNSDDERDETEDVDKRTDDTIPETPARRANLNPHASSDSNSPSRGSTTDSTPPSSSPTPIHAAISIRCPPSFPLPSLYIEPSPATPSTAGLALYHLVHNNIFYHIRSTNPTLHVVHSTLEFEAAKRYLDEDVIRVKARLNRKDKALQVRVDDLFKGQRTAGIALDCRKKDGEERDVEFYWFVIKMTAEEIFGEGGGFRDEVVAWIC